MDQSHGLEARISKGGARTTLTMDSEEIPPLLTRVCLPGQVWRMGTIIRTMED